LVTLAPSENFGGTLREQGITRAAAANTTGLASVPPMDSIIIRLFESKNGRKGMNHGDTRPVTFMRYPLTLVLALALCSAMMPVPGIVNPLVMVASDGELGHPRNAGTYARILAHYVRDQRTLALMDGIRKMSLMPAQRLESSTSAARRKGRLQEGADADVVVFDPSKIVDRSTYEMPNVASTGMRFVIVGGVLLIDQGKLVSNTYAGTAICRTPCTNRGETP
jgi:hypothetical protein